MGYKICAHCHQRFFDPKELGKIFCSVSCRDKSVYETRKRQQFHLIFKNPQQFSISGKEIKLINKGG